MINGNRRPDYALGYVSQENEFTLADLPVEGEVPDWLFGSLVRLGPGKFGVAGKKLAHHFCGFGMLHRFGFHEGRVSYRNRFVKSKGLRYVGNHSRLGYNTYATAVTPERFQEILAESATGAEPNVDANVSIARIADDFVALTDGSTLPVRYDPDSLETLGLLHFDDELTHMAGNGEKATETRRLTTAHCHLCPTTGDLINYFSQLDGSPGYTVFRIARGSRRREPIAFVPTDAPAYMHAFHITPRYVVLPESPFRVAVSELARGVPIGRALTWRADMGLRLHIVDRLEKKYVRTVEVAPSFVEHTINAYERADGELVVDGAYYPDARHIDELFLDPALRPKGGLYDGLEVAELVSRARFARSRIDVAGGRVRVEQPFNTTIELPTIDYAARNGQDYSVFYAASIADDPASTFYNQLARIDVTTGDTKIWRKSGHYPGEAVFVKNRSGEDPDDGVLLSVVLDTRASASYLAVLDAKTLSEHATVRLPHHIPFHFHGQFHGGAAVVRVNRE